MAPELPPAIDPALWFDSDPCGRHYLVDDNPHTFRGRLVAYCPQKARYTRVSKQEIGRCSRETEYFVRGYLAGNEPPPPVSAEGDALPDDGPQMRRWWQAVDLFRETGFWIVVERDPCPLCGAELLPSEPEPDDGQPCRQCPPPAGNT